MANPQPHQFTRISNELFDKLIETHIPGRARQFFELIIRKTYGYGKKSDHISHSQFAKLTKTHRRNVVREINTLKMMNMISVIKNDDSKLPIYSINKDYETWVVSSRAMLSSKRAQSVITGDDESIIIGDAHKRKKEIQKKGNSFPQEGEKLLITQNGGDMDFPIESVKNEIKDLRKIGWQDKQIRDHFLMREIPQPKIDLAFNELEPEQSGVIEEVAPVDEKAFNDLGKPEEGQEW